MSYWEKELKDFREFLDSGKNLSYKDWQPTKWQSLQCLKKQIETTVKEHGEPLSSILELGCGSSTLLLSYNQDNLECVGVDTDQSALNLATLAGQSMGGSDTRFLNSDFWNLPESLKTYDMVFSVGVIEHFDFEKQLEFLKLNATHSNKWVLVAIPNYDSPIFNSYLKWAELNDCLYPDEHEKIDVPKLINELDYELVCKGGLHLFFAKSEYYIKGNSKLDKFYESMRNRLCSIDPEKYTSFPNMNFKTADIDALIQAESEVSGKEKYDFGFLRYYLIRVK